MGTGMRDTDPRVYFAAERTLLAWVRTGIGVMAFGFVVAKFALFLQVTDLGERRAPGSVSAWIGTALVLIGTLTTAIGAVQYRRFCARLVASELPSPRAAVFPMLLAWALVVLGMLLVAVLLP